MVPVGVFERKLEVLQVGEAINRKLASKVISKNQINDARRKVGCILIKPHPENYVGDVWRKVFDCLVEIISKNKVRNAFWKVLYFLIKLVTKC